ncbi:MAG TPA: cytochrome C oxidase subunit IV family protein [Phycisphaerae bacterium]|jgi:cytochrome c oxidase subunit 4
MHAHARTAHGHEDLKKHVRIYISVFVALMFLTVLTVVVSYFHPPIAWAVAIALLIACTKGSLVALYFMHLISEVKVIYWTLGLCVVLFGVLMLLPTATEGNQSGVVHHNDRTVVGAVHAAHGDLGEHSETH